jgi:hypothetical protein
MTPPTRLDTAGLSSVASADPPGTAGIHHDLAGLPHTPKRSRVNGVQGRLSQPTRFRFLQPLYSPREYAQQ